MIKNLIDNSTGLSYEIIDNCNDRDQLLQWKVECLESLHDIKSSIEAYEFSYNPEVGHLKFDWYMRAKKMRQIKSRMDYYINIRLSKVNAMIKQQNIERTRLERIEYFKNIAK